MEEELIKLRRMFEVLKAEELLEDQDEVLPSRDKKKRHYLWGG